jgi:putative holliday junction resolvase
MAIMIHISALALDVGSKRIGVAGCDGTGLIATGLMTIDRSSFEQDVEIIRQLIVERSVSVLVVGLPYTLAGELGAQARQVQKFARRVSKAVELPVEYIDERLTSVTAEQLMMAEGKSPRNDKGMIDRKAAALILQDWLNQRRAQLGS